MEKPMSLSRAIEASEILERIKLELQKAKERLLIYRVLTVELEKCDRKKITSRIEKDMIESLGKNGYGDDKYHVHYFKDNYERVIHIRGRGQKPNLDERITIERLAIKTQPLFEFEKWYEGSPVNGLQERVLTLEGYLGIPECIEVMANDVNEARYALLELQEKLTGQDDLSHLLLPEDAYTMVRDLRYIVS